MINTEQKRSKSKPHMQKEKGEWQLHTHPRAHNFSINFASQFTVNSLWLVDKLNNDAGVFTGHALL